MARKPQFPDDPKEERKVRVSSEGWQLFDEIAKQNGFGGRGALIEAIARGEVAIDVVKKQEIG